MDWLMSATGYHYILIGSFVYAALILVGAVIGKAPYGKLGSERHGVNLSPRLGWFLMELPATLSFLWFYAHGRNAAELVPMIFLGVWLLHYGNRGFVFPLLMRVAKGPSESRILPARILTQKIATRPVYYRRCANDFASRGPEEGQSGCFQRQGEFRPGKCHDRCRRPAAHRP